jgi:hypothetical protein
MPKGLWMPNHGAAGDADAHSDETSSSVSRLLRLARKCTRTQAPEPTQPSLHARRMGVDLNILHASSRSLRRVQRRMTPATFPTRVGCFPISTSPGLCASAEDELTQESAPPSAFLPTPSTQRREVLRNRARGPHSLILGEIAD